MSDLFGFKWVTKHRRNILDFGRVLTVAVLVFLAPVLLWLAWAMYGVQWFAAFYGDRSVSLGQTGDVFGGVNALFAAFAFAGVAVAAYFQFRTNQLQQQGLILSAFEPLFFHLLELHRRKFVDLQLDTSSGTLGPTNWGRPCTPSELTANVRIVVSRGDFPSLKHRSGHALPHSRPDFEDLLSAFDRLYLANEHRLGPYYRAFYHVFNLIDESGLTSRQKVRYSNIARSTLDKDELLLLMLNCSRPRGMGLRRLVERYGLLKHISTDDNNNFLDKLMAATLFHPDAGKAADERLK